MQLFNSLERVRTERPLVHCITNFVTANDCANALLALGASPILADDASEAAEVTSLSRALVLNLGTLSPERLSAMEKAGRTANARGLPVVLDPVGAGALTGRLDAAKMLLSTLRIGIIRCNAAELSALAGEKTAASGVDACGAASENCAARLARETGAVVAVTGKTDLVTNGARGCRITNGVPALARVTGTGCVLSALTGAFAAANDASLFEAATAAVCAMGLCGEIAARRLTPPDGTGSFRVYLMDAVSNLTPQMLLEGAKFE